MCKAQLDKFLQSRPLPRSHAPQYGLREEEVTPGARVCNTCRCKSVRSRYTQCPLPTCPNAKGRIKRLRPLPGKWTELPLEIKDPIIAEFRKFRMLPDFELAGNVPFASFWMSDQSKPPIHLYTYTPATRTCALSSHYRLPLCSQWFCVSLSTQFFCLTSLFLFCLAVGPR